MALLSCFQQPKVGDCSLHHLSKVCEVYFVAWLLGRKLRGTLELIQAIKSRCQLECLRQMKKLDQALTPDEASSSCCIEDLFLLPWLGKVGTFKVCALTSCLSYSEPSPCGQSVLYHITNGVVLGKLCSGRT